MALDVSAITGYVKANEKTLVAKSILGAKTLSIVKFQPEVKGSAAINVLVDAVTLQAGGCGWNPAGTTTLSKRVITTGLFKVNEALCEKTLAGTYAEWGLNIAVGRETLPFEEVISDTKVKGIQKSVELLAWNGNTTGNTSTYLDVTNGYVKIIGDASGVIDATVSGKTLSGDTIYAIDKIVAALPNEIIAESDLVVFVGQEILRSYITAYNASNQFAGTLMLNGADLSVIIPNTGIKLQGVAGLNGKNKAYASTASNFIAGGDINGSESMFELFYSQDNREFRFAVDFNIGFQVAFPEFIVKYTI